MSAPNDYRFEGEVPARVRRRAAEWLALREARGFTAQEHADFAEWLGANAEHRAAFAEIAAGWVRLDGLAVYPHSPDAAPDPDLLAGPRRSVRWSAVRVVGAGIAAAAVVTLAAVWWWRPAPQEVQGASEALASQSVPTVRTLPDRSVLELNGTGEVTEHFTPAERRVRLVRGEAHFTVTPNPERPFVVEAGGVTLRALGTAFNVRLEREAVDVLVTHGRVQVTRSADSAGKGTEEEPVLAAQQQITLSRGSSRRPLTVKTLPVAEVQRVLGWQTNRIVFDAMPLAEVVARFNRARAAAGGPRLMVGDPQLGALRFSGRLRVDDLEGLLEMLEISFGVTARREAGEIVLVPR
jgi:transmembrane sensor